MGLLRQFQFNYKRTKDSSLVCVYISVYLCMYIKHGVGTRIEKVKYSRLIGTAVNVNLYTFSCENFSHTEKEKLYSAYQMTVT